MRISDWSSDVCSSDLHYMESATAVDLVAERIRALGFPAPGTYKQYAALSSIPETDGVPEAMEMVRLLVKAHEACAKTARSVFPIADKSADRSEEHTSELQSLMRTSYAVFCLTKKS